MFSIGEKINPNVVSEPPDPFERAMVVGNRAHFLPLRIERQRRRLSLPTKALIRAAITPPARSVLARYIASRRPAAVCAFAQHRIGTMDDRSWVVDANA
jgi:hypothetical protein